MNVLPMLFTMCGYSKQQKKRVKTKKAWKKPPVDWNRNGNESVFFA